LKLLADAGLLGLPNAGKSTFINAVTNANAKVGAYPFTTTRPQLGVVSHHDKEFVIADIPGLIEGAADGAGIGDRFLGHIERCRVLLHLVDATGEDPVKAYRIVRKELKNYGAGLLEKPEVIGLNKIDAIDPAEAKKLATKLKRASKAEVLMMSGASGQGIPDVLDRLSDAVGMQSSVRAEAAVEWSPI
jgi:GTPase